MRFVRLAAAAAMVLALPTAAGAACAAADINGSWVIDATIYGATEFRIMCPVAIKSGKSATMRDCARIGDDVAAPPATLLLRVSPACLISGEIALGDRTTYSVSGYLGAEAFVATLPTYKGSPAPEGWARGVMTGMRRAK